MKTNTFCTKRGEFLAFLYYIDNQQNKSLLEIAKWSNRYDVHGGSEHFSKTFDKHFK